MYRRGLLNSSLKETGIKVIYSTYEPNETMYAKLKTYKDGAYDLVVPTYILCRQNAQRRPIQKIDKSKLTTSPQPRSGSRSQTV